MSNIGIFSKLLMWWIFSSFLFRETNCFTDQKSSVYRHYSPVNQDDAGHLHAHPTHAKRASSRSGLPRPHPTVARRHLTPSRRSPRLLQLSPSLHSPVDSKIPTLDQWESSLRLRPAFRLAGSNFSAMATGTFKRDTTVLERNILRDACGYFILISLLFWGTIWCLRERPGAGE